MSPTSSHQTFGLLSWVFVLRSSYVRGGVWGLFMGSRGQVACNFRVWFLVSGFWFLGWGGSVGASSFGFEYLFAIIRLYSGFNGSRCLLTCRFKQENNNSYGVVIVRCRVLIDRVILYDCSTPLSSWLPNVTSVESRLVFSKWRQWEFLSGSGFYIRLVRGFGVSWHHRLGARLSSCFNFEPQGRATSTLQLQL